MENAEDYTHDNHDDPVFADRLHRCQNEASVQRFLADCRHNGNNEICRPHGDAAEDVAHIGTELSHPLREEKSDKHCDKYSQEKRAEPDKKDSEDLAQCRLFDREHLFQVHLQQKGRDDCHRQNDELRYSNTGHTEARLDRCGAEQFKDDDKCKKDNAVIGFQCSFADIRIDICIHN